MKCKAEAAMRAVSRLTPAWVLIAATCFVCSCGHPRGRGRPELAVARIDAIRAAVLKSATLSDEQRRQVESTNPSVGYYKIAGTWGQTVITWKLSNGQVVTATYTGASDLPVNAKHVPVSIGPKT
jgi:hypothetical protein